VAYHLVCVHPFGVYAKGDLITDAAEVESLMADRDHHFVRITAPDEPAPAATEPPVVAPSKD
jgi:hypothetical protein